MFLHDTKELVMEHKKSPVEFARKDSLVICSSEYRTRVINPEKVRDYMSKTRDFMTVIDSILKKNEIFIKEA